ncbi:peptidoglycan binding domain-containing protein [Basidiobolus meristosporus CBS 931.73]|uniref:Peptidoglycan binding domain-containing protein n=1 Tax=Basidiobolus meristosporus CBS 931.73 TaxID=1314790 RepID=A0A1Y1YGV0_9FUNG|nr:peptidoglycan binding domain-containing protein [Basidiobolus meristosporus CBS 931.73]|eukprot:ORX96874.1 peptidoglycan binding domain-containing protein [Basidiobolus meristosporus CBS 931.73]
MTDNCLACKSTQAQGNIKKRLIVCCDGTFNGVDKGTEDYSSNVARLSRVISRVGINNEGEKVPQIVYYQSGVGTGSLTHVDKARQGAFGDSLAENVCEAYNFLANNWGPGDEIFLFGFSRGAYTARSLAGFICQVGLLTPLLMDHFFEVYSIYKSRGDLTFEETAWAQGELIAGELGTVPPQQGAPRPSYGTRLSYLRKAAHEHVKIKVVGVWDTVGSLRGFNWFGQAGEDKHFHSTKLNPKIENAFQALALDETRGNFPPTLWYLDSSCCNEDGTTSVNLKQCWFPGYHSDVGGQGKGSADTSSVDEIAFSWMCDQLFRLLQLSGTALQKYILFRIGATNLDTMNKSIRNLTPAWRNIAWNNNDVLIDTNSWSSFWWVPSLMSSGKASYCRKPGETKAFEKAGSKEIHYDQFMEEIHPSVSHRVKNVKGYMPAPFVNGWKYIEAADGVRARWEKSSGGKTIVLNEYLIPKLDEFQKGHGYDHWQGSLERTFAPKDVLAVQDEYL